MQAAPAPVILDPLLQGFSLPVEATLHPLGFPLELATNSGQILEAARRSWGHFAKTFSEQPVRLRVAVAGERASQPPPAPVYRAQSHLMTILADRENFAAFLRSLGGRTVYPGGENLSTARDMAIYLQAILDFAKEQPALGERLLDDLAHSIYHVGLPGELPPSVRVAHKEGDLLGVTGDVGVVFAERPFIFTVLSDGQPDPLAGFKEIAHLTRLAYDYQNQLPR